MGTSAHPTANVSRAAGAAKALLLARLLQSCRVLCFSPEMLEKLSQRQAGLELDAVHGRAARSKMLAIRTVLAVVGLCEVLAEDHC
jgi:hypothetical protein